MHVSYLALLFQVKNRMVTKNSRFTQQIKEKEIHIHEKNPSK